MLETLVTLYDTLAEKGLVPHEGWGREKVRWYLTLDASGKLLQIEDATEKKYTKTGKEYDAPKIMEVPLHPKRGNKLTACAYCDNAAYLLGPIDLDQKAMNRDRWKTAREFHLSLLKDGVSKAAKAICRFFIAWDPESAYLDPKIALIHDEAVKGGNFLFKVNGHPVTEDPECRRLWDEWYKKTAYSEENRGTDLVTGEKNQPLTRIFPSIKGARDGLPTGVSLISFNKPAFEHYSREQGLNAPIGIGTTYKIFQALDYLYKSPSHKAYWGNKEYLFWTKSESDDYRKIFFKMAEGSNGPADLVTIKKILEAQSKGEKPLVEDLDPEEPFYILALSPNSARLSISSFLESTFGKVLGKIARHHERMELYCTRPFNPPSFSYLLKLAESPGVEPSKFTIEALVHSVLWDAPYPAPLFQKMLTRIKAEKEKSNYFRCAFIKAYLLQNDKERWHGLMAKVNKEITDVPYVLGRLFSILEAIQDTYVMEAGRTLSASIRDKYFNAVCANPAVNFPIVLKLSLKHLNGLSNKRRIYWSKQLGEIMGMIQPVEGKVSPFPTFLTLKEQGAFVLGYYQQEQERYTKKEDRE